MRVVVVGGSGRTGALVVTALLRGGHAVVATIRNPRHMVDLVKQGVEVAMIDLDSSPLADIEQAFKGADAVVFAAGSAEGDPSSALDRKGVQRTVLGAKKAGVPRYVAISGLGATTRMPQTYDWPGMKDYFKAKRSGNETIRKSGLAWTIIEPGTLADAKATGKVALSEREDIADRKISRADVAAVVAAALGEPRSAGRTFQIVGGPTPVVEAVRKAVGRAIPKAAEPVVPTARSAKPSAKAPTTKVPKAAGKAGAKKAGSTVKATPARKPAAKKAAGTVRKTPRKTAPAKKAKAPPRKRRRS